MTDTENGAPEINADMPGPAPAVPDRGAPFIEGSFAMYATAAGDIVLVTYTAQTGDQTMRVPRFVVNQAKRANPALAAILAGGR